MPDGLEVHSFVRVSSHELKMLPKDFDDSLFLSVRISPNPGIEEKHMLNLHTAILNVYDKKIRNLILFRIIKEKVP